MCNLTASAQALMIRIASGHNLWQFAHHVLGPSASRESVTGWGIRRGGTPKGMNNPIYLVRAHLDDERLSRSDRRSRKSFEPALRFKDWPGYSDQWRRSQALCHEFSGVTREFNTTKPFLRQEEGSKARALIAKYNALVDEFEVRLLRARSALLFRDLRISSTLAKYLGDIQMRVPGIAMNAVVSAAAE